MKYCFLVWVVVTLLYAFHSYASVRTVEATERAITPIYLSLGRSTVLRFRERPKKVVLGNQNYFNVEFIDSDLAIQPTGAVNTNLFVYGESHTYGFSLHVSGTTGADDLVHVAWWVPRAEVSVSPSKQIQIRNISKVLRLSPNLQMRIGKLFYLKAQSVMWLESFLLSNKKERPKLLTQEVGIQLFQNGSEVKARFVCQDEKIEAFQENACRVFFPAEFGKVFGLKVKFKSKISQINF